MEKGLIIKSTGSWHSVKMPSGVVHECKIRGKFRMKGIRTTNPIAVGDWVDIKIEKDADSGFITKIHQRKNYIIRKSINLSKQAHILAANVDQAFLIVTLASPATETTFIDRFLVSAEAYSIPVNLVFNKVDLYDQETIAKMDNLIALYEKIEYTCLKSSATEHIGIEQVQELMKGKVNVISGHSGVGKSTLINALDSELNLKTGEISDYHKAGKHTTTFSEMFELSTGGYIIDTPGIKGFGVIDMEKEEVSHFFPEMFKLSSGCQFHNCSHTHEPKCVVKSAVEEGEISMSRYNSYLSIISEDEEDKYRTTNY